MYIYIHLYIPFSCEQYFITFWTIVDTWHYRRLLGFCINHTAISCNIINMSPHKKLYVHSTIFKTISATITRPQNVIFAIASWQPSQKKLENITRTSKLHLIHIQSYRTCILVEKSCCFFLWVVDIVFITLLHVYL